jgi:cytochrome P450
VADLVADLEKAYLGAGTPEERQAMIALGQAAKDRFGERYFLPALAEHARLVEAAERDELAADELPRDLLTLLAGRVDPAWADVELALREATTDILFAGTANSVHALVHVVDELGRWFERHPEDRARRHDSDFLARVVSESLRIHVINVAFFRQAVEDVVLGSGLAIPADSIVRLGIRQANRDRSVFGADAGEFNPRRALPPAVPPYGLAFGSGPHMCYGLNVVLGPDQVSGTHVHMLSRLLEAGIRNDPERAARRHPDRDLFVTYPVMLAAV